MITKRNFIIVAAISLILALISSVLAINISKVKASNLQYSEEMTKEKEVIKTELKELKENYSTLDFENEELQLQLEQTKFELDSLYQALDEVELQLSETSIKLGLLKKYRYKLDKLKNQKGELLKANDSLTKLTVIMTDSLKQKDVKIREYFDVRKKLFNQNLILKSKINERKKITFFGTTGTGVKLKRSGKVVATNKLKRTEKLKVCTTVRPNAESIKESKKVYLKILNPNNEILGEALKVRHKNNYITYSAKHQFFYDNETVDFCKIIGVESSKLIQGKYTVEVYFDHQVQDISQFTLR